MIVYDKNVFGSSREIDPVNGYLRVEMSNITKSQIRPYLGREIPDWRGFDLDPNKIYNVLCPEEELIKALPTFNSLPLTRDHIEVDIDNVPKEKIVGSLGDHATYEKPYVKNNLIVYDKKDIDLIMSGKKKELSCGYRYTPVKEDGQFEGQHYDFKMTDIVGNHIALVKQGRAGRDVMVADSIKNIKDKFMSLFVKKPVVQDSEEDVEWITVRGTHIPIKNGEDKEKAVVKFFSKMAAEKNHERKEQAREESKMKPETVKSRWEKEKKDAESTVMKYEALVKEHPEAENYKDVLEGAKKRIDEANSNISYLKNKIKPDSETKESNGFQKNPDGYYERDYGNGWYVSLEKEKARQGESEPYFLKATISDPKGNIETKEFHYSDFDSTFKKINRYVDEKSGNDNLTKDKDVDTIDTEIPEQSGKPQGAREEVASQQGEKEMAEEVKEEVKVEETETAPAEKPVEDACSKDACSEKVEEKTEEMAEEKVVEDKAEQPKEEEKSEKVEEGKEDKAEEKPAESDKEEKKEEDKKDEKKEEMAKDSALVMDADAIRAEAKQEAMEDFKGRDCARKAVRSIVGDVDIFAFDSAEEIYKFACEKAGMDLNEIANFKDAFNGLKAGKAKLAMDASPISGSNEECFKNIRLA